MPRSCASRLNRRHLLGLLAGGTALGALTPLATAQTRGVGTWRTGVAAPEPVQEVHPALHQGRIHMVGGLVATDGLVSGATSRHWVYGPRDIAWRDLAPLPSPRHHVALASAGGRLYAVGGYDYQGANAKWVMLPTLLRYVDETDAWIETTPLPEPAGEVVCLDQGPRIHVIGGRRPASEAAVAWREHRDDDKHYCFDTDTQTWERRRPAPTWRHSAAGARLGDQLHVVGGRQMRGGNLANHDVYDTQEDRWRRAAPMPAAQSGLAAAAWNGRLYAFGGESIRDPRQVYAECWVYDPAQDAWDAVAPLPTPRHGIGAVTMGDLIHVIAGAETAGGVDTTAMVELFDPR